MGHCKVNHELDFEFIDFFRQQCHTFIYDVFQNKLYVRVGRKKTEIYEINKDTLEVEKTMKLDPGPITPIEPKSAVFTDGNQLGLILLTNLVSNF